MKRERKLFPELQDDDIALKNTNQHDWVESSFTSPTFENNEFLGTSIPEKRISFFFLCATAILGIFFFRTAYLQLLEGRGFATLAERNKVKTVVVSAKRGIMTDRNGSILVRNVPNFRLQVIPSDLPKDIYTRSGVIERLSTLLAMPQDVMYTKLKEVPQSQAAIIAEYISYTDSLKFDVAISDLPGVELTVSEHREYINDDMRSLAHVLGYTGRVSREEFEEKKGKYGLNDTIGKDGLELSYEDILRGVFGKREIEVDALGIEKSIIAEDRPKDGSNLVLALDANLQKKTEGTLRDMMKTANKKQGVVIVSKPSTGEILALVALPVFDNNAFAKGIPVEEYTKLLKDPYKPLFNRAIRGEYPSGSTIKMIVAAAALQENVVKETTRVLSNGGIRIGEWFFPDWKAGGHGMTDVRKALAESVNTFFYYVGGGYHDFQGLGVHRLTDYFEKFGIGEKTGIDVQGERDGFLPSPEWKKQETGEIWYIGDTY
ncbi:MAG: penicillin-binding transpeptidase domain-containing protein, partial [bacterium]|nr:penicillin-binding transpeptidase domain-containing protein [bacterium]